MKTYCLVCKNYIDNNKSRVVKNKQRLMLKSNCSVCGKLLDSLGLHTPQNRMKNALWNAFR